MIRRYRKFLISVVTTIFLIASITLAIGVFGHAAPIFAQAASPTITDVYVPTGQDPWGTTFDTSGHVWVAIPGCDPSPTCSPNTPPGKLAAFDPVRKGWFKSFSLPSNFAQALFLAFDNQGRLWFPMPMNNSLGMLDPSTNTFSQWAVPTSGSGPWGIAIDSKGIVWFTEHYSNKVGAFNPLTQTFLEYSTPATNSNPYGITVDSSDNVWFTENNDAVGLIGLISQGQLSEYKIRTSPVSGLTPHLITTDHSGNVWWSEGWAGAVGRLNIASAQPGTNNGVAEYGYQHLCTNCGIHTSGIAADNNGQIWFDDSLQSTFGSLPVSGTGTSNVYNTPTPNSHPHDGLNVDATNTVWFTEEFANKLGSGVFPAGGSTPTPAVSPTATPGSTPTPTVSPTPTPGTTPTVTPTATPTPGSGTILSQDTFQRASQTLWGTASDGNKWGADANTSNVFSISSNSGYISNGGTNYSAILGPTAVNEDVVFSGSISAFNYTNFGSVVRWTDTNNWYKAYIDGSNLVVQKKVNGSATVLGRYAFSATPSTSYTLRFQVIGTTLNAKVWPTGSAEPGNWMVSVSDSTFSSGNCGLRMLVQNGATVTITSFKAVSL